MLTKEELLAKVEKPAGDAMRLHSLYQVGEPTCYIFALKLVASQKVLEDCPLLFDPQYSEQWAALRETMTDASSIGETEVLLEKN